MGIGGGERCGKLCLEIWAELLSEMVFCVGIGGGEGSGEWYLGIWVESLS